MDKELKEKWVAALRSGKYKQGRMVLRDGNNNYCCLGVLCDLIDNTKWKYENEVCFHDGTNRQVYSYDKQTAFLSEEIQLKYLDTDKNRIEDYHKYDLLWELANMNDQNQTFNQIANYIEKNL